MPFNPSSFSSIASMEPQGNPLARNLMQSLMQGYQMGRMPAQMKQSEEAQQLANVFAGMKNQQEPERFQSSLRDSEMKRALEKAQVNDLNRKAERPFGAGDLSGLAQQYEYLQYLYKNDPRKAKEFEGLLNNSLKNKGMGFGSAPIKMQENVIENIMKDNPGFNPQQARDAADAFLTGGDTSGINISGLTQQALGSLIKYGTDAASRNFLISGAQAEAELPIINEAVKKGAGQYETNIMGWRPGLTRDTAKAQGGDKAAINRLSDWVVKDILSLEGIQLQQRLQTGKVTVSASDELLNRSKLEGVGTFNSLPGSVQTQVVDKMNDILKRLYDARKKAGINPLNVMGGGKSNKSEQTQESKPEQKKATHRFNPGTGKIEVIE